LKELNGHVKEKIDRTTNPITAQMLREQQAKIRKRAKPINNFGELSMSLTRNTYNTLKRTVQNKFNHLFNLRDHAEDRISEMEDELINLDEDIDNLIEENNGDDEITPQRRRENNRRIRELEDERSDTHDIMTENEILLNETLKPFNRASKQLLRHNLIHPQLVDFVIPPPPMLGNNYDVQNGLLGLERDVFLRLAVEKHHNDDQSRQMFGMGRRFYKWRNNWLWRERNVPKEDRVTKRIPQDYGDKSPDQITRVNLGYDVIVEIHWLDLAHIYIS
jgi:hypothetical protein